MTGNLQEKYGKYYAVINSYSEDGKRKQRWYSTGLEIKGNKKKAEKFLRDKIDEIESANSNGKLNKHEALFSEYVQYWLNLSAIRIDPVTLQGYTAVANTHIIPYFQKAKIKLTDLDLNDVQTYFNYQYMSGRIDGKGGLSAKTLRIHKAIIQQTLKEAQKNGLILTNSCDFVTLPQMERFDYKFYTQEQLDILFKSCKDERLYPLIKTTLVYGLRRSEVLGLKWDSVNLETNTLTIKHTVAKVTEVVEKDRTKNASSYRTFPLVDEVKQFVIAAKREQEQNKRLCGNEYVENDYIFKWENGKPYSPDYVTKRFSKILKQYGLPPIRFHDLRHSSASFLIAQGFTLKDIQEWLGHSDIKITANIYSHLDLERKEKLAKVMSNV